MPQNDRRQILIGREQELGYLMQALAGTRAENPAGCIVFVEGIGGLGKTALVESFESHLKAEEILYCKIELLHGDTPDQDRYRMIRNLFDKMFLSEKRSLDRAEIWNSVLGEIGNSAGLIPILSKPLRTIIGQLNRGFAAWIKSGRKENEIPLDASKTNEARRAQVAKILQTALKHDRFRPTVLIIDNFHLVDIESANMLLGLSDVLGNKPFMILCTYRPDEIERKINLRDLIRREFPILVAEGGVSVKTIPLGYLTPDGIAGFFKSRYPTANQPSSQLCEMLQQKIGGNPLLLQEALAFLRNKGVLGDNVRSIDMLEEISDKLTGKGKNILGLRVDHLKDEMERAYTIHLRSSVVGEKFNAKIAESITNIDEISVIESLNDAINKYRLIQHESEEEPLYRYRHALIHEEFFKRATEDKQLSKLYHHKAAKALEQMSGLDPSLCNPARIAELYLRAKEPGRAIKHLQIAVEAATQEQAYSKLVRLCRLLLSAMDDAHMGTDKERFELFLTLGRSNELIGKKVDAVDALNNAVHIAENLDEKILLAMALTYYSISQFHAGDHHESSKAANRALDLFRSVADSLKGEDLHTYGICLNWVGENYRSNFELDKAYEHHQEACDVARRCGSKRLEANARANMGAVHMWRREYSAVLPHWQEALCLSSVPTQEDWPWIAHYTIDLGLPNFLLGEYGLAMKYVDEGLKIAEDNFFYDNVARGRMNKGSILFARSLESTSSDDRLNLQNEAYAIYEMALPIAKAHSVARIEWRIIHNMGNIHRCRGELDKAKDLYEQAVQYIERMRKAEPNIKGFMQHRFRPFLSLMLLMKQKGRPDEEIVAIANRSCNDYVIKFAEDLNAVRFDETSEAEKDRNFVQGYYIETE